jgi:LysM repeat protein
MSRRDTILVAVLINSGLLALLFLTAVQTDFERELPSTQVTKPHQLEERAFSAVREPEVPPHSEAAQAVALLEEVREVEPTRVSEPLAAESFSADQKSPDFAEITVKRGDFLARIARSHGVSVSDIMKANQLDSHRLKIGQVLKVPLHARAHTALADASSLKARQPSLEDAEYYTIQKGDNPWTIAKKNRVAFDELLRLNDLDEAKARNLKVGDKLRVR